MHAVEQAKPRLIVVTRGDALKSITYIDMDSEQYLHDNFQSLNSYINNNYKEVAKFEGFLIYQKE